MRQVTCISLCFGLALLLFVSCNKDALPDPSGLRLKLQVNHYTLRPPDTAFFTYNSSGKMATALFPTAFMCRYEYDAQGRLAKFYGGTAYIDSFVYNNLNQIIRQVRIALIPQAGGPNHAFAYDAQGRLIGDSVLGFYGGQPVVDYGYGYSYDSRGNITEKRYFNPSQTLVYQLTFDDHPNPLRPVDYFTFGGYQALSRNNIVEDGSYNLRNQYDYYDHGLPWNVFTTPVFWGSPEHVEYYYE